MELGCVSSLRSSIVCSVQLEQCKSTIERMRREIIQKNSIISDLAAQAAEGPGDQDIAAPLIEEDCDMQQYKSQVQSSLEELTAERDALEARASGHKKVVTMLQAQIASLKLKAGKSDESFQRATSALKQEQSRNKVCGVKMCTLRLSRMHRFLNSHHSVYRCSIRSQLLFAHDHSYGDPSPDVAVRH